MNNPIILILFTFLRLSISSTDADPNPTGLTPVWKLPILNVSHRCDFDIVQAADIVDLEKFRNQYPRKNRPVLIKGATRHWPAFTLWTKKYIYRQLSEWKIPGHGTGIAGIINDDKWSKDIYSGDSSEGFEMDKSSVVKHPNAASPYIFSSLLKDGTIDAKGVSDFKPLDDTGDHVFSHWKKLKGSKIYNYFSLGGSDSGLSLHAHEEGYCGLIQGVKRWFMIIPDEEHEYQRTYYEKTDAEFDQGQVNNEYQQQDVYWEDVTADKRESFVENVLPKMRRKPLECYQHPGDMIYVPNYYPHTVFNIGETVAVSAIHLAFINDGFGA